MDDWSSPRDSSPGWAMYFHLPRLWRIRKTLSVVFGFTRPSFFPDPNAPVCGKVEGRDAAVGPIRREGTLHVRILISGDRFLPSALELVGGDRTVPSGSEAPDLIALRYDEIRSILASEKKSLFTEAVIDDLRFLHENSSGYCISRTAALVTIKFRNANGPLIASLLRKTSRLVSRLTEITGTTDLYGLVAAGKARRNRNSFSNPTSLDALFANYRRMPDGRLRLQRLLEHSNFDVRYRAAQTLGLNLEQFVASWVRSGDSSCRVRAIRWLCETRKPYGVDFLFEYFSQPASDPVKLDIVRAFRDFSNPRTEELLLLAARKGGEDETIMAALGALTVCGGKTTLGIAHRIARNFTLPAAVRAAAQEAVTAIRARLGEEEAGRLSLADGDAAEGGLSRAEGSDNRDGEGEKR